MRPEPRALLLGLVALGLMLAIGQAWTVTGSTPGRDRPARLEASPQYNSESQRFENALGQTDPSIGAFIKRTWNNEAPTTPEGPVPVDEGLLDRLGSPPEDGLRISWVGHSTLLIELEGRRILTDPIFSDRPSPLAWLGPKRFMAPALSIEALPPIDGVLISHDHYDHLDMSSIKALSTRGTIFYTPLGVGAHLEGWGVSPDQIMELDWWEEAPLEGLKVACLPSRHFSGRGLFDGNQTLWASWALLGADRRVYFSGDTALSPDFLEIGERYGPFDIAAMEAGAYDRLWPDVHLGPEQAADAFLMVRGRLMIPIHWGTFNLALHGWTEPAERLLLAAADRGIHLVIPQVGASVGPNTPATTEPWWPRVPWESAEEAPVVSTELAPDLPLPQPLAPLVTQAPEPTPHP